MPLVNHGLLSKSRPWPSVKEQEGLQGDRQIPDSNPMPGR